MKLTNWFYGTTPPVRPGVYETRIRSREGHILTGYAQFKAGMWCINQRNIQAASRADYASAQQMKEWRGLAEEPK